MQDNSPSNFPEDGARLAGLGYQVVPLPPGSKGCFEKGWTKDDYSPDFEDPKFETYGTGFQTRHTPAVDIDVLDPEISDLVIDYTIKKLGKAPKRIGKAPKTALVYRTSQPFKKACSTSFEDPKGVEHRIEVLGEGQQLVALHEHPDTGQPYQWDQDIPDPHQLPLITVEDANDICEYFEMLIDLMRPEWKEKTKGSQGRVKDPIDAFAELNSKFDGTKKEFAKALSRYSSDCDYSTWINILMAIKSTQQPWAFDIAKKWSARAGDRFPGDQAFEDKWNQISAHGGRSYASILHKDNPQGWPLNKKKLNGTATGTATGSPGRPRVNGTATGTATGSPGRPRVNGSLKLFHGGSIVMENPKWLWNGRLPLSQLTLLAGMPSTGKTSMLCNFAATITNGKEWPGGTGKAKEGKVMILMYEDVWSQTIAPRLVAAGANMDRIVGVTNDGDVDLVSRLDEILAVLDQMPEISTLIIDPFDAYLGLSGAGLDSWKPGDVREAMRPLLDQLQKRNVTLIGVQHLNKATEQQTLHRLAGSAAFGQIARSVYCLVEENKRRAFTVMKNNLAGPASNHGFYYSIHDHQIREGRTGELINTSIIRWEEPCHKTATDIMAGKQRPATKSENAAFIIETQLAGGPKLKSKIIEIGEAEDISPRTMETAAKSLGVKTTRDKNNNGWWNLPQVEE
jgi:putative DNA primase/helicase